MLATIYQAERFGDDSGPLKRRFVLDLLTRVFRRYNQNGLPFIAPIEETFVKPFLGVSIDWCVAVLNLHGAWPPVKRVQIPKLFHGRYGRVLRIGLHLLRLWVWLSESFVAPTKYERNLRHAERALQPEIDNFVAALPPAQVHGLVEELATMVQRVGQLTAPHLNTIDALLRLSNELRELKPAERRETIVRIIQELLRRAYARNSFAVAFIDSAFGDFFIREMVENTEWVLARNGLLPAPR